MTVVPFPPPPPPPVPPEEDGPPQFDHPGLTAAQEAMHALLGSPEIVGHSEVAFYITPDADGSTTGVPSITGPHVMRHQCPIVEVLERRRAIMPNGDLHSVGGPG